MNLVIHLYVPVWNEAELLPYFFRHYDFVDRFVVYDNGSDDGTLELLKSHPRVEVRSFVMEDESIELTMMDLKRHCWKESRGQADLVIVCDVDEFLWHPELPYFLESERARGVSAFHAVGWQMVSATFPAGTGQLYEEVCLGFRDRYYNKVVAFDPNRIEEIGYTPGCHTAAPTGTVQWSREDSLKLLHFKYLSPEFVIRRYRELAARHGSRDRRDGLGTHYFASDEQIRQMFDGFELRDALSA